MIRIWSEDIFLSNQDNTFEIMDHKKTKAFDKYQPMRGEITRVYLFNSAHTEEQIVQSYFSCDKEIYNKTQVSYDWSNVLINNYLAKFKRKRSGFCNGI